MQETLRHTDAFEYYYSLGDKRNLIAVAQKFKISAQSTTKWNKTFKWQERIKQRNDKNAKTLARRTDNLMLKSKLDYRKEVQNSLVIIRAALSKAVDKFKDGTFLEAENPADLALLINAQDKLIRLDYLLGGEEERPEPHTITVVYVNGNQYQSKSHALQMAAQ